MGVGVGVGVVGVGGTRDTCFENELKGDVACVCVCVICRPVSASASTRPSTFSAAQNWLISPGLAWPGLLLVPLLLDKLVF